MIQIHVKYKGMKRFYATRLSILDVLARLAAALREKAHYMQLRSYIDAYSIDSNQCCPLIRIIGAESHISDKDSVEIRLLTGSEYFTLGELSDRFPPS